MKIISNKMFGLIPFLLLLLGTSIVNGNTPIASNNDSKENSRLLKKDKKTGKATKTRNKAGSLLLVQTGRECSLRRGKSDKNSYDDGSISWVYSFVSTLINKETIVFSERPLRLAQQYSTEFIVKKFDTFFKSSNPNVVVTFVTDDDAQSLEPLVAEFYNPSIIDNGNGIQYDVKQYKSQVAGASLESFFEDGGNEQSSSSVTFRECSLFIDSVSKSSGRGYYGGGPPSPTPPTSPPFGCPDLCFFGCGSSGGVCGL